MDELISYLKVKRNLINLLTLGILILGLPIAVNLARNQQIFFTRAGEAKIEFLTSDQGGPTAPDGTSCVQSVNGKAVTKCQKVSIKITAPPTLTANNNFSVVGKVYAQNKPACDSAENHVYLPSPPFTTESNGCEGFFKGTYLDQYQVTESYGENGCDGWLYDTHHMVREDGQTSPEGFLPDYWCFDNQRSTDGGGSGGGDSNTCFVCSDGSFRHPGDPNDCNGAPSCPDLAPGTNACTSGTDITDKSCTGKPADNPCFICDGGKYRHPGSSSDCNGAPKCPDLASGTNACTSSTDISNQSCGGTSGGGGGGGGGGSANCAAAVSLDNGKSWSSSVKDGVNKGDTNVVSVRTKDLTSAVSSATLLIKDPSGTENPHDWKASGYYRFDQAGTYTLTAKEGACSATSTATVVVKDTGSGDNNKCYLCREGKFGKAGDPNDCKGAPTCPSLASGTNACTSDNDISNQSCGSAPAVTVTSYRIAEDAQALKQVAPKNYKDGGVTEEITFSSANEGKKVILVQFKYSNGTETLHTGEITMMGPPPKIGDGDNKTVTCSYDIKNDAVNLKIPGKNFGSSKGKLTINETDLSIDQYDDWKDDSIKAHVSHPQSNATGTKFRVKVAKADGQFDLGSCAINITQFDLGAKWMCRAANTRDIANTTLSIYDMTNRQNVGVGTTALFTGTKVSETVTISKDGTVKNIKTKLNEGSPYRICIKPPLGVKTCSTQFTFAPGTVTTKLDVPIGDLNDDGIINNIDAGLLKRQFGVGPNKTADFLQKGSVNSFDWGCLVQNFNKSDALENF